MLDPPRRRRIAKLWGTLVLALRGGPTSASVERALIPRIGAAMSGRCLGYVPERFDLAPCRLQEKKEIGRPLGTSMLMSFGMCLGGLVQRNSRAARDSANDVPP